MGRLFDNKKEMCDGEKEDDRAEPDENCLETTQVLQQIRIQCQGKSTCSIFVESSMADLTSCLAPDLKRELRTSHICGMLALYNLV